ncbi:ubiquitin carboxyl-terminal hydrolase [Cordyceps javanica]|uniref:Ubiquitin carboxyl-terminal hydrolase n=1 Tax=Cordyceps javanica TaxID=43265 RepID=A0A545VF47_9HYPO|nr:ubiquitin carboxyl-terminal hydrolase [Cordyceps javanica]
MDKPAGSIDGRDVDLEALPETSTRPKPFEDDDAARKRRRTSASASMSPAEQLFFDNENEANNPHDISHKNDQNTTQKEAIPSPETHVDNFQTPAPSNSSTSLDPSSQLTLSLRRMVEDHGSNLLQPGRRLLASGSNSPILDQRCVSDEDRDPMTRSFGDTSSSDVEEVITPPDSFPFRLARDKRNIEAIQLQKLSEWMQKSAIEFLKTSDRSTVLLALQSQRKFWLSLPAAISALTTTRPYSSDSDLVFSTTQDIFSLYSLLTAALVEFDHRTLQLELAKDVEQDDELVLFCIECLHTWYDLLHIEERETSAGERLDGPSPWTRCVMSRVLLSPFVAAQGNTTQWISTLAYYLSKFATTSKFRLRDFTLIACIISDCVAADHQRNDATHSRSTSIYATGAIQQTRKTWLALSDALSTIIEKKISILSSETANRLVRALASIFSIICQSNNPAERNRPDGIDTLLETYQSKYPEATPDMLQKAAPWEWKLDVLSKLIQSGLMQLRVMAVNILCSYLADVWAQEEMTVDGRNFLRHLGRIVDNELIGYIVSPSCHPEIIVASANIIVFLVLSDASTEPLLDRLWHSIESSQDPRVADAITRVTSNVISVLRYEHLVHLCEKFNDVKLMDLSPLLRNLWENLIGEMVSKAQLAGESLTVHPFLSILRVLREMPTSNNGASYAYPELQMVAMQRARDLLNYGLGVEVRKQLYRNCCLTETYDIVRVVVEELESAVSGANDQSELILAGHANSARRDLISQIIHFQPKSITEELGGRLWEALEFNLDHEELVAQSGIQQLWRIILSAHDEGIAKSAIVLLASGVYLESKTIGACTVNRAQNIHLKLVRQCLRLMREARHALQAMPTDEDADDDSIVLLEPESELTRKKLEFLRTLRLLHYFLDAHRANTRYAAADLRSLIPECAADMKGEPTTLQYQAFGDDGNGEVKPLRIGRENSLGSLLAVLRDETGFESFKAYYRGRQLIPNEAQVQKSLRDLRMCDGLILLSKDVATSEMPNYVKPGSSPIEIEILSQFSEFWQYLIMDESMAAETYNFLLRLPADGDLMQRLGADDAKAKLYESIFLYLRVHKDRLPETMQFLDELVPFYADGADPYIYDLPFQFDQQKALRSPAGYVGLQNLSNTCYLNSLITQLYMNPGFRNYLLSFDVDEVDNSKVLLHETQRLFMHLQESINRSVEPAAFVGAIKTYDQGPIDIHSQMDVDEFYNLLFDRWEAQLPNAAARKCGHISERLEPFSAIQCDIKGKSTLEDSLRAYVGGETMDGDNKYKCSSCDRHVDAVKRACLNKTPDNMIFHLKRFEFNLQTLQRSKIDDYFAFPDRLDLQPYTVEHLSGSAPDGKQDMFELVGVLVHAGTAESGHYYSYVRERSPNQDTTQKWVEFNDDQVGIWNHASMEVSTFGGPERRSVYEENSISFNKSYSAYMLFYQRISPPTDAAATELATSGGIHSYSAKGEALKEHIHSENILLLRRHCLFDPNHAKFVQACVYESLRRKLSSQAESELDEQPSGKAEDAAYQLVMSTALSYLDQIFSRNKDCSFALMFCNMLIEMARTQQGCAWQTLKYFQLRPAVLRSLLLRNPERNVRVAVGQLFVTCLGTLSRSCPESLYMRSGTTTIPSDNEDEDMDDDDGDDGEKENMLSRAMEPLDQLWKSFQHHIRAWDEYFLTILDVAQLGRRECGAVLAGCYLEKCLKIITADRSMELEPNFVKMLQNVYKRFNAQPPSYVAVLALIDYLMSQLEPEISGETIVETVDERLADGTGYFPWTSKEVSLLLLSHPEQEDSSLFMARLLEINQAPECTRRILERIIQAGELPTRKLLHLLEDTIRGDASTDPLDVYIRAASIVVDSCNRLADAQNLVQHIGKQAASFERGEGEAFLGLIRRAIDSKRPLEEERAQMRLSTLLTIPQWGPFLLQYPDSHVRNGAERLVDMALCIPAEADSRSSEAAKLSSDLGLAIGKNCLSYLRDAHIERRMSIEREYAAVLIRVLTNCSVVVAESETLDEETKDKFSEQRQEILEGMTALVVDRAEDDGSDWEGSALSSEPLEDEGEIAEATAILGNDGCS